MPASITAYQGRAGDRNDLGIPGALALATELSRQFSLQLVRIGQPAPALNTDWKTELEVATPDLRKLASHVSSQFSAGHRPITILNRCAAAIATIPCVTAQWPDVCVVWFDAHADLNTPDSTTSGYLGGLALSGPAGLWDSGFGGNLSLSNIVLVGSRDLDPFEIDLVSSGKVRLIAADSKNAAREIVEAVAGRLVYIHLDCDVLEPGLVPTDFQVAGGLSMQALHSIFAVLATSNLIGLEIAEFQYSWGSGLGLASTQALMKALQPLLAALQLPVSSI